MSNLTKLEHGLIGFPLIGGGLIDIFSGGYGSSVYFVDGDNGNDGNQGQSPDAAFKTIQTAITTAAVNNLLYKTGSTIYIKPKYMAATSTDPVSYTENIVIPNAGGDNMRLIGVSDNRTQGGLPQLKIGTTTTQAVLTSRAPGLLLANLGINGGGGTGGGILLDDNGTTKVAMGTTIANCHFKNCTGTGGINGKLGGAIQTAGSPWQVRIAGNRFYKNLADITTLNVTYSDPQDWVIENNIFSGTASETDLNLYITSGASGAMGVIIRNNVFPAFPNISSGVNKLFFDITGVASGIMCDNVFAGNGKTFDADDGTGGLVPTTCFFVRNYQEQTGTGNAALVLRNSA